MSFDVVRTTLASAVADGATFSVAYPAGRNGSYYTGSTGHLVYSQTYGSQAGALMSYAFGASSVTITNNTGATLAAGTDLIVQLDRSGRTESRVPVVVSLGAPIASDADGVVKTQACTASGGLATGINGDLATDDVATFDVPRNVVAAWTGTAVLTVTGTDEFGEVMVESSASGTSLTGKKAFKTVTGIAVSADVTGLTVGTSKVLGLPIFLEGTGYVLRELEDGAAPTAGTVVAGVTTAATATTGDVRGTYAPNSTPNGSKAFDLVVLAATPYTYGVSQYAG